jgi:hypothetical protein
MTRCHFWLENFKGRTHAGKLNADGTMILKWLLEKCVVKGWEVFKWLKIGPNGLSVNA